MVDEYRGMLGVFRASREGDFDFIKTAAPNDRFEDDGFLALTCSFVVKVALIHAETMLAELLPVANTLGMDIVHENGYFSPWFGYRFGIFLWMILPTIDDMRREVTVGSGTIPAVAFSVPFEHLTVLNKTFLELFDVDRLNVLIIIERLSGSDTGTLADNHVLCFQAGRAMGDVAGRETDGNEQIGAFLSLGRNETIWQSPRSWRHEHDQFPFRAEGTIFENQQTGNMCVDGVESQTDGIKNLGL